MTPEEEITELRRRLHEAEQRLQSVATVSGPLLGTLEFGLRADGELLFLGADDTAARLLTVAQAAYYGKPLTEVFTGMAGTDLPDALRGTARDGVPLHVRSFVPPGTRLARAFALFAFQSAPGRAVMKFWESSARGDAQEIARRNEELLSNIFQRSPVAIAIVDDTGPRIVDVNAEWSRLTGYSRERSLGRDAHELGLWPDPAQRDRALAALRAAGHVHDMPLDFTTPDGRAVRFSLHGAPIRIRGARHFLVYLLDVTQRDQAEARLRRLNSELEQRVERRTAELARARDEAERASRAKSDFLSGMSHELRTPMNAILGFAQLLAAEQAPALPAPHQAHVKQILRAGAHLLELINEVLDLARIESGKLQISLEPVGVAALLDDCLALMQPVAREQGVELVAKAPQDCDCHVLADGTRARQVLLNLLSNAVKYNREGGRVWVECEVDAGHVRIGVGDTGPGLSAEQQSPLFRDFERLDADQAAIEGTGIGLALSRRLVTMMQGEIGVRSEPGAGSTFWVRLQRAQAATPPPSMPAPAGPRATPPATRCTLLYVEDNPVNVVLMEAFLRHRPGVRMVGAALPQLGLEVARADPPDLILLDIQLPGMDGYELLRRLRAGAATRAIPVVAVSANAMPSDVERGLAAGFDRYLTKPLQLTEVLRAVDELSPR